MTNKDTTKSRSARVFLDSRMTEMLERICHLEHRSFCQQAQICCVQGIRSLWKRISKRRRMDKEIV